MIIRMIGQRSAKRGREGRVRGRFLYRVGRYHRGGRACYIRCTSS